MSPDKYVLFSHFCPERRPKAKGITAETAVFDAHFSEIEKILKNPNKPGLLTLFYDSSWLSLLNTVGRDFNPLKFTEEFERARRFQSHVEKVTPSNSRIRLVTAADLFPILNNLRGDHPGREATRLRRFLSGSVTGRAQASRYDTSKVVEAIVRLRQIGSGIPVFRIDWDALFNTTTLTTYLPNAISTMLDNYDLCNAEPTLHSFVASAGYVVPEESKPVRARSVDSWLGAFATRVFPALLATDGLLKSEGVVSAADLKAAYDPKLVQRFYGLRPDGQGIEMTPVTLGSKPGRKHSIPKGGITSFGSHPFKAVISGALLCLSDGAILDLPPFSNFRQNVMWIDDHLKYALHRELEHLSQEPTKVGGRTLTARVPDTYVFKDRPDVKSTGKYTLGSYLPTVLGGTIMDAWIQPNPVTNVQHLHPKIRDERKDLFPPGVLTSALANSLTSGRLDQSRIPSLTEKLRAAAMKRVVEVVDEWSVLKGSLAHLWVTNPCDSKIPAMSKLRLDDDWIGWGLFKDPTASLDSTSNLSPKANEALAKLIEDAINYIEWTLEWPRFIQSVRAVPQGALRCDLRWNG